MNVREIIGDNSVWMPNEKYDEVKPLVSVLLPTYSRAKSGLLEKCIDSVLQQSFRRLELIVVVDASTDGTLDICKSYAEKDSRVQIIWHKQNIALPAVSTYEAYMKARGEYMAYAFDDNVWELDAIAKTYDFMEQSGVKASYGVGRVTDPITGQIVEFGHDGGRVESVLFAGNCIAAGAVVLNREVLETVGLHDPHLALTRVCDWDLWQRVSERYRFTATEILFTTEHGTTLDDSLGNAFKLDQWFLRERQQHRDLKQLLPENYESADVTEYSSYSSRHFLDCLSEHYRQYSEKAWHSDEELQKISSAVPNKNHRYVLVPCLSNDASIQNFHRYQGDRITLAYTLSIVLHSLIASADAVVFIREIDMQPLESICKHLSIPSYYFTDDNFRELAIDNDEQYIKDLAAKYNKSFMSRFTGVIVTTQALQSYFLEHELHEKVLILPAVYKEPDPCVQKSHPVTIGFMGGVFRQGVLNTCALPALYEIAKKRKLRLVLPCTKETESDVLSLKCEGLEIIPFYRTKNYEYLLNSYQEIGIDILIHTGPNLRNNISKTKNALLNATYLNAPLLVSDIEPYCDFSDGSENCYVVTHNTPEAWLSSLERLIDDSKLRNSLVDNAKKHCTERFSSDIAWAEAEAEFCALPYHNTFYRLKQYEKLCAWFVTHNTVGLGGSTVIAGRRQFSSEDLSFTGKLEKKRRFGFTAEGKAFTAVGLLFEVIGSCTGTVNLSFYHKGAKAPAVTIDIDILALQRDTYTHIRLPEPIITRPGELMYLDVSVSYEEQQGYVGMFEDRRRRTFIYKVFNKLGHPIPGRDALIVDCR